MSQPPYHGELPRRTLAPPFFTALFMNNIYTQLQTLGIDLPPVATPAAAYVPFVVQGSWIYLSGHIAKKEGLVYSGQLGLDMSTAQGYEAAKRVAIDLLGTLHAACLSVGKDLNQIDKIVKVMSLVNSTALYTEQHLVTNGCSELLLDVLGPRGQHARSAFGVAQLPMGACVEIELVATLTSSQP